MDREEEIICQSKVISAYGGRLALPSSASEGGLVSALTAIILLFSACVDKLKAVCRRAGLTAVPASTRPVAQLSSIKT